MLNAQPNEIIITMNCHRNRWRYTNRFIKMIIIIKRWEILNWKSIRFQCGQLEVGTRWTFACMMQTLMIIIIRYPFLWSTVSRSPKEIRRDINILITAVDIKCLTEVNSNEHFSSMLQFDVECLVATKSNHSDDSTDNNESIRPFSTFNVWNLRLDIVISARLSIHSQCFANL